MTTKKFITSGLILGTMLLVTAPARAVTPNPLPTIFDPPQMYAGTSCKQIAVLTTNPGTLTYDDRGNARNDSNGSVTVACPMAITGGFLPLFKGEIVVYNQNLNQSVLCQSKAFDPFTPKTFSSPAQGANGTSGSAVAQVLQFNTPVIDAKFGRISDRYYTCILPPKSGIFFYTGIAAPNL